MTNGKVKNNKANKQKNYITLRISYWAALIIISIYTLYITISSTYYDLSNKVTNKDECIRDTLGNYGYNPAFHHDVRRNIAFILLAALVIILILTLSKYKNINYRLFILVIILIIGAATSFIVLTDAVGLALDGIKCIPF